MTRHSVKQFRLAATLLIALGLGFTRILPVQASTIAQFTDSSNLEKNYQFNLENSTLAPPSSAKNKPLASGVQAEETGAAIGIFSTKSDSSTANRSSANQSQKEPGDASGNGFLPFALIVTLALIIYNLLNRRTAAAQPAPPTAPSTLTTNGANAPTTILPPAEGEKEESEPVTVPTPALLPGLLGLGLKLMRQKEVESQAASELEVS
ncbi:MAG: PTPA-CTERM sorting domain-containing protein [Nodosilinea sp.]